MFLGYFGWIRRSPHSWKLYSSRMKHQISSCNSWQLISDDTRTDYTDVWSVLENHHRGKIYWEPLKKNAFSARLVSLSASALSRSLSRTLWGHVAGMHRSLTLIAYISSCIGYGSSSHTSQTFVEWKMTFQCFVAGWQIHCTRARVTNESVLFKWVNLFRMIQMSQFAPVKES